MSAIKRDTFVTYGGERPRVDALDHRNDTVPRTIDKDIYHIWTQKREVGRVGEIKLLVTEKRLGDIDDEGTDPSVKYIVLNKIDAPASHRIELYVMRWRIETFFRDTQQDLGLGDCELRQAAGASRHWHLWMLAYNLLKFGVTHNTLGMILALATPLQNEIKQFYPRKHGKPPLVGTHQSEPNHRRANARDRGNLRLTFKVIK